MASRYWGAPSRRLLSDGTELGPTEPMNLAPDEKAGIKIDATGHVFEWWTTYVESDCSYNSHSLD